MTRDLKLLVRIGSDVSGLKRGSSETTRALDAVHKAAARAMAAVSIVGAVAVGRSLVGAAATTDSFRRALDAVSGSSAATAAQLVRLKDVARAPGLGFREAIQGSVNLQAVGFGAEQAERALKALGTAIATTGGGAAELDRVVNQLTQMRAIGKVTAQDLKPIIQTAPAVARALQELYGTTSAEAIESKAGGFDEFFESLMTKLEAMPSVAGGAKSSLENLGDATFRLRAAIGDQLLPAVVPAADALASIFESVADSGAVLQGTFEFVQDAGIALAAVVGVRLVVSLGAAAVATHRKAQASLVAARASAAQAKASLEVARAAQIEAGIMAFDARGRIALSAATGVLEARQAAYAKALTRTTVAGRAAGVAMRGLGAAFGLVGGWPGVIAIGLGALIFKLLETKRRAKEAAEAVRDAIGEATAGFATLNKAGTLGQMGASGQRIGELQAELAAAKELADAQADTRWVGGQLTGRFERVWKKEDADTVARITRELEIQRGVASNLAKQYGNLAKAEREADDALDKTRPTLALTSANLAALTKRLGEAESELGKLDLDRALALPGEELDRVNKAFAEQEELIKRIRAELGRYSTDTSKIPAPGTGMASSVQRGVKEQLLPSRLLGTAPGFDRGGNWLRGSGAPRMAGVGGAVGRAVGRAEAAVQKWLDNPGITAAALKSAEFAGELAAAKRVLGEESQRREEINRLLGLEQQGMLQGIMNARSLGEALRLVRDRVFDAVKGAGSSVASSMGNAFGAFKGGDIKGGLGALFAPLKGIFTSLVTSAGPLIIIFELIKGVMDAIKEPLQALLLPVRMLGEVIGKMLMPIFKLLFPVLKAVAIAVSYVAEVFYTVSGYLLQAVGAVIEAIGKLVKWISFGTVKAIQNAGAAIKGAGKETIDAAKDMKDFRRDLREMDWADAMDRVADGANKATSALLNVPQGFKVALARFNATVGAPPSAPSSASPGAGRVQAAGPASSVRIDQVVIHAAPGEDAASLWDRLEREAQRRARRGGAMVLRPAS